MMTVGQLAQHFLAIEPQKKPARLAFYHYLKNFYTLEAPFKQECMDAFYDRALSIQHWQANKLELGQTIKDDLESIAHRYPVGFDIEQVVHAHELQVIQVEQPRDFAAILARDVAIMEKNGEKIRSFRLATDKASGRNEVLFVRLQTTGNVVVEIRQNLAILVDGQLQLLRPHSRLVYNQDLEFEPGAEQVLSISLLRTAVFAVGEGHDDRVKGRFIQGASFHCPEGFHRQLGDVPELVQAVKKVERLYVNPVSDPYYSRIIENFEALRDNQA
jgi:hypothetical protein